MKYKSYSEAMKFQNIQLYSLLFVLALQAYVVQTTENLEMQEDNSQGSQYSEVTEFPASSEASESFEAAELLETTEHFANPPHPQFPGELCRRPCRGEGRRVCLFTFTLEHYQAMGIACGACNRGNLTDCENSQCVLGDGIEKGVMSINRQIPGPDIQVCKDDIVIIDVVNNAAGTAAAIHWHGMHMYETPWMDGVPFVTQCPIPFATTFRYQFAAREPGTHYYHSHSGHHKASGQYGALIVRQPEDEQSDLYDYDLPEHYMLISDWMHEYPEQYVPGLRTSRGIFPDSGLINGRGTYLNPKTGERTSVPPIRYYVTPGKRYRFRLINAISHACPFQLQVERHTLNVISSDGLDVEQRAFDTLVTNSGERYDFILDANLGSGDYWIRVRGMGVCGSVVATEAFALLRYRSNEVDVAEDAMRALPPMPSYAYEYPIGIVLNHPNASCFGGFNDHCISELNALTHDEELRYAIPDHQFFLGFNNYEVEPHEILFDGHYPHFANLGGDLAIIGAMNNLSLVFPDYPLLTQPENIDASVFCNNGYWPSKCLGQRFCPCVHLLRVKLGSVVELVVVDESTAIGRINHPFHLHGHVFMVTGLGQHPSGAPMTVPLAKAMDRRRVLPRSYMNASPPFKDTVSIPSRGYAVIRFRATNPGFWLMHCHYEWHLAIGMGLILQVGEIDEMVPPPKDFPKCSNYKPDIFEMKNN